MRRSFLGLLPKRCQARLALSVPELTAALRATPRLMAEVVGGLDATERLGLSGRFGPVTLAQYATHAADHDQEHLAQMRDSRAALPRRA